MRTVLLVTLPFVLMTAACSQGTVETLPIDNFEYASEQAAQQAWQAAEGSDPVGLMPSTRGGGKTALKVPCPFTREELRRAVCDRHVQLDLTQYGTIVFDLYVADSGPIGNFTIYFHSGDGWYSGHTTASEKGWREIRLPKAGFGVEGQPAGWDKIDTIRLSAWKAFVANTFFAVDNLRAERESVVVVNGSNAKGGERRGALQAAKSVHGKLTALGVTAGIIDEGDVERGALTGRKMALFAYSPNPSDEELSQVEAFVHSGGKIMVFYSLAPRLAKLLGVRVVGWKRAEPRDAFHQVLFDAPDLIGLPKSILQDSWNANMVEPAGNNARVIGTWANTQGVKDGPAVILSDTGAYMGHILTGGDDRNKALFLLAIVGHFVPEAWVEAANKSLERSVRIGRFQDRARLERFLQARAKTSPQGTRITSLLQAVAADEKRAASLLEQKQYAEVVKVADKIRGELGEAYALAQESRDGEFRAVWNHSGTGDCGTWEEAMKRLAAANFNAVVPNMWWAGLAHYDSKLLPHSQTFRDHGDQIAQALVAGRKYGIEVHPWKVNWNLGNAPKDFLERMRAAGRTQKTHTGEDIDWLCPSNPENFKLELDTMLEVALNYDVDGIHFDYIRYPHGDSCYCEGCHRRFEEWLGAKVANWPDDCYSGPLREKYRQWRCEQINRLVKATSEAVRRAKPWVKISAAVFNSYPNCRDSVGQDWVRWAREGWVDFLCPMDYTDSDARFRQLISRQVGLVGGAVPVYSGIGYASSGSSLTPDRVIGQILISREQGSDGFIIFNMGESLTLTVFPELVKGVTSQKAVLPHKAPTVRFKFPLDTEDPVLELTSAPATVTVTVPDLGHHRTKATSATGDIELQDLTGKRLARLAALPAPGQSVQVKVPAHKGTLRLAAVGTMTFEGGKKERFIRRSRPFTFAQE